MDLFRNTHDLLGMASWRLQMKASQLCIVSYRHIFEWLSWQKKASWSGFLLPWAHQSMRKLPTFFQWVWMLSHCDERMDHVKFRMSFVTEAVLLDRHSSLYKQILHLSKLCSCWNIAERFCIIVMTFDLTLGIVTCLVCQEKLAICLCSCFVNTPSQYFEWQSQRRYFTMHRCVKKIPKVASN